MGLNKLVQLATRQTEQFISQDASIQILSKVSQPDSNSVEGTLENISQVLKLRNHLCRRWLLLAKM
jgi:precorrin-4 methylase